MLVRRFPEGSVVAIFPDHRQDDMVRTYVAGEFGECWYNEVMDMTEPASEEEFRQVYHELLNLRLTES
jgi:hypothetical protein